MSDLEHWVWWLKFLLTLFAKIIIWSDSTFESYSNDWISVATITYKFWVNNFCLISLLFLQMLYKELLILRSAALAHLVAQNLLKIFEKLIVYSSNPIAFLAW